MCDQCAGIGKTIDFYQRLLAESKDAGSEWAFRILLSTLERKQIELHSNQQAVAVIEKAESEKMTNVTALLSEMKTGELQSLVAALEAALPATEEHANHRAVFRSRRLKIS